MAKTAASALLGSEAGGDLLTKVFVFLPLPVGM